MRSICGGPNVTCESAAIVRTRPAESRYFPSTIGNPSGVQAWTRLQAGAGWGPASAGPRAGSGFGPGTIGLESRGAVTTCSCLPEGADMTSNCLRGCGSRPSLHGDAIEELSINGDESAEIIAERRESWSDSRRHVAEVSGL